MATRFQPHERRRAKGLAACNIRLGPRARALKISYSPSYDDANAQKYARHHLKSVRNRFTTRRERSLVSWALEGFPGEIQIIDLACGAGRMWPPLLDRSSLTLPCLDDSPGMLRAGLAATEHCDRLSPIQGSIFSLPFADLSADAVVCMRFMHHLALPEDRQRALAELFRVTRSVAVISLWVDGNLQAWRRRNVDASRDPQPGFGRRRCLPRTLVEAEFADAGFTSMDYKDLYPKLSSWRTYRLEKTA